MNTFITASEAPNYFSEYNDYDATTAAQALRDSFGLVCAYLAPEIRVPLTSIWDGDSWEVPSVLKICQSQFLAYLLQTQNVGYREDLAALYAQTVEILKGITAGELNIDLMTSAGGVGWTVLEQVSASGILFINQPGIYAATYPTTIKIQIDSVASGTYPSATTYKYGYPQQTDAWTDEGVTCTHAPSYTYVGSEGLAVAFGGKFNPGDYWVITGNPTNLVEQPQKLNTLVQRRIYL